MSRLGTALLLALCPLGEPVRAQESAEEDLAEPDQDPDWIPSLSVDFETFQYSTSTTITNSLNNPPAWEGTDSSYSPQLIVRFGGELMGPSFESLPGRPRLFVQGSVGVNTFQGSEIGATGLLQGDTVLDVQEFRRDRVADAAVDRPPPPGGNGIPDCQERNPPTCATANAADFEGQGSEVTGELQTPEWNVALGVAFDFPVGDSLLFQFKPSVTYNYEQVDFTGTLRTVIEEPPGPTFQEQEIFTIYEDTASGSTADQSLGLGLELDLALFRSTRPIRASLYLDTRFLWLLSDPSTTLSGGSGTQTTVGVLPPFTPVTTPTDPFAGYQVERDSFEIRGGAGVRFSWVGFGPR